MMNKSALRTAGRTVGAAAPWSVAFFTLLLAAALGSCGDGRVRKAEKADLGAIVLPPEPLEIRTLWENRGGGASGDDARLDVVVDGGLLLTVGSEGDFVAVDRASGDTVWERDLEVGITAGAGGGDGLALVVDEDGMIHALDARDGSLRWNARVPAEVLAPPAAGQGVTVVRTTDGRVIGLSSDGGGQLWVFRKPEHGLSVRGSAPPVISGGVVYNAFAGGEITANEIASGQLLWETNIVFPEGGNAIERLSDIDRRPLLVSNVLYAGSPWRGELAVLELASPSSPLWRAEIAPEYELAVDRRYLYAVDREGIVHALDRNNGGIVWSQSQMRGELSSAPVMLGGYLLVGGESGALYLLNTDNGTVLGRRSGGGSPPLALRSFGGEHAYLLRRNGEVSALVLDDS